MKKTLLTGTYTEQGSRGIYRFGFEDGILSEAELFAEIQDPKYICTNGKLTATVGTWDGRSGCAVLDENGQIIDRALFEDGVSCYITWAGDRLYCANYHAGHFTVLEYRDRHLEVIRTVEIREKAGCHQVIVTDDRILVPCLFLDAVKVFDHDLNELPQITFPDGTGPRHGIMTKDGKHLYLASELSNELFEIETENWTIQRHMSVLPDGKTHLKDTAAIRLSEDEKTLYVSTRTLDVVSVIDIETFTLKQCVSCGGSHPRDIYRLGQWLLSANRFSDTVCCFALHEDGTIGEMTGKTDIIQAVSLDVTE